MDDRIQATVVSAAAEARYTLAEAQRELARQECARFGHRWDVVATLARPTAVVCDSCGKSYKVMPDAD